MSSAVTLLIERMAAGDRTALSALYELTVDNVYGLVVQVSSSKEEAQAVVCDIYVSIWHSAAMLHERGHAGIGWLLETAHRKADRRAGCPALP